MGACVSRSTLGATATGREEFMTGKANDSQVQDLKNLDNLITDLNN